MAANVSPFTTAAFLPMMNFFLRCYFPMFWAFHRGFEFPDKNAFSSFMEVAKNGVYQCHQHIGLSDSYFFQTTFCLHPGYPWIYEGQGGPQNTISWIFT